VQNDGADTAGGAGRCLRVGHEIGKRTDCVDQSPRKDNGRAYQVDHSLLLQQGIQKLRAPLRPRRHSDRPDCPAPACRCLPPCPTGQGFASRASVSLASSCGVLCRDIGRRNECL
jgi:hypothetical protein